MVLGFGTGAWLDGLLGVSALVVVTGEDALVVELGTGAGSLDGAGAGAAS